MDLQILALGVSRKYLVLIYSTAFETVLPLKHLSTTSELLLSVDILDGVRQRCPLKICQREVVWP